MTIITWLIDKDHESHEDNDGDNDNGTIMMTMIEWRCWQWSIDNNIDNEDDNDPLTMMVTMLMTMVRRHLSSDNYGDIKDVTMDKWQIN